jgi:hypothetical protein
MKLMNNVIHAGQHATEQNADGLLIGRNRNRHPK